MSDVNSNINVNIDTSGALASIKDLQRQISLFHQEMARSGSAANQAAARSLQSTLMNNINATGQFRSQIKTIQSETEHFTEQLERNKMSVGQYFRYAGAATKNFGRLWKSEFNTIEKVAIERVKTLQTQYIKLGRDANGALKAIQVRPLALDMNNLATKAAVAAQKQQLLNQLLKQGSTAMLNWGKNTQWAGRQLMVGFTIPLSMAGTAAAKAYIEFEKAAIKFKRVYGDFNTASSETDKMADSVKKLALEYTKYGVAVADTMNMAADAAAMGKTGTDLLQQIQQANKLAVLGNVEQSQALETTMSLTNAFGIATQDLTKKIDFLNAVENQTVTSIEDLTIAIPKAAPVIKQLGGDVEDLAYFLTAMKEGGVNAAEGANALKSGLASMINPTKKASDFLSGLGINIQGIVEANKGDIAKTVTTFAKELDKLDPLNRARAIEQLFGKFQFSRMSTLFQNISKDGSQAQQVLKMTQMTAEELSVLSEREMKKIESSPAYKFQKVLADIQAKLVPIGEAFLKAITPIIEKVGGILDGFNNMGEGAKQFAVMATVAIAGIGPVALMAFGLIANGVANLIKMFAAMKSFFNGTRGGAQDLGDTTAYMTQKELEAQAVASSLEQSHAKLTQQFTVQADAIRNLVAEYERAIGAQQRLAAGSAVAGGAGVTPTRKMAEGGIVTGPGGPTDDAVPTNLSDGEAVIPAAAVKKNPGVVGALIQGKKINIPGYAGGFGGGEYVYDPSDRTAETHLQAASPLNQDLAGYNAQLVNNMLAARPQLAQVSAAVSSHIEILGSLVANLPNKLNENLKRPLGVAIEQFDAAWEGTSNKLQDTVAFGLKKLGESFDPSNPQIQAEIAQIESQIQAKVRTLAAQQTGEMAGRVTDAIVTQATSEVLANSDTQAARGLRAAAVTPREYRTDYSNKELSESIVSGELSVSRTSTGTPKITDPASGLQVGRGRNLKDMDRVQQMDMLESLSGAERDDFIRNKFAVRQESKFVGAKFDKPAFEASEATRVKAKENGAQDAKSYQEGMESSRPKDPYIVATETTRNSPIPKAGKNGAEDAQLYSTEYEKNLKIPGVPTPGAALPKTGSSGLASGQGIPGAPQPPAMPAESGKTNFLARMKSTASDLGDKALGGIANGIDKGKAKVTQAAQSYVDNWNASIDREVAANRKASSARMDLASRILEATDAEYAAIKAEQDAYQAKLLETNQATEAEIQAAVERSKVLDQKRQAIARDIENSGEDLKVIEQRLANAQQADMVNDLEAANAAQDGATVQQRGAAAQGGSGTTAGQIIYDTEDGKPKTPMTYGEFRNNTKGMTRKERKAEFKNLSKADRKSVRAGGFKAVGGGMQKAAMVGTMVAGAASMMPGPVGEAAQQATPLLGSLSMLSGFITGPVSGAFVALAAVIGGIVFSIMKLDEAFKNSSQEQIDIANKLGSSAEGIATLAEASGSVTGAEYMDKVNAQKMSGLFAAPGKTTFGENFVKGDAGKAMLDAAKKQLASGGSSSDVSSSLSQQLSTGVMSGALSADQARSIAANIGLALGDTTIGLKANAQIVDIVGPDGKAFEDNPAMVATKLYDKNAAERETLMKGMNPGTIWSGGQNNAVNRNITAGGTVLGAAGVGAGIGAAIGSVIPGVGTAIGAVVGTIGGAIVGSITAIGTMEEQAKKAGRAAGAVVANISQGLEQQKQITASLDAYYDKKLKEAEAEGDITEYKRLQLEYDQKKKELGEANAKAAQDMIASYDAADQAGKDAMDTGMTNALDTKFKDDAAAQLVLPGLKNQIQALKDAGKGGEAFALQAQLLNGMDPTQLTKFLSSNEGGTDEQNAANTASTDKLIAAGGTRLQDAMNVAQGITDQTVRTTFLTQVSGMDDAEAKKAQDLAFKIQSFCGVMQNSVDTMLSYVMDPANADAKAEIDRIQGALDSDNVTTVDKVYEIVPELEVKDPEKAKKDGLAFNEEYFKSLKNEQQQETYVSTVTTLLEVMSGVTTTEQLSSNKDFMAWVQETGQQFPGEHSVIWWKNTYAEAMGQKVTSQSVDNTGTAPKPKTDGGGGGGGPEAHWTDEVVKSMRDFVKPNQKLTTGINASVKALKNFKKAGDAAFNGLSNSLRQAGASEGMLQKILEDDAKNVGRFFKNGKLTAEGLKVQARVYQASLGKYVDSQRSVTRTTNDQATAMRKLTAAGLSYVGASEMVQDTELAQAIAKGATTKQIKALIKAYKDAQVAAYNYNETTEEGRAKNSIDMAEAQTKSLEATAAKYQTGLDIISSQEEDINKTYDKRMKALDKILQVNQEIADSQKDQLSMADALSKGDIFAAAKAMADQKSKDAQKQAEAQKQALTDAKDAQIAGLTATIGGKQMNREQLEQKIKDINDQILQIKRNEIDAQNELIARKEYEAKLDIEKAARNAPAKKSGKTKKVNAAGGGPAGGGPTNGGPDKKDPGKQQPATVPEEKKSQLDKYKDSAKKLNSQFATLNKSLNVQAQKIVAANKKIATAKQMGSAGAGPLASAQKDLANARENKAIIEGSIRGLRTQRTALINKARNSEGWLSSFSPDSVANVLGINFKKDGKSPKRMGLMKHPFARGTDMMPTMVSLKEFTMQASAVRKYGVDKMMKINAGMLDLDGSKENAARGNAPHRSFNPVYNVNVEVAKSDASAEEIASAVIKYLDRKDKAVIKGLGS
jgi:TP901 family phage tail tape measure protein